ncbi:DUF4236 domain-containing protein [Nitrolancea hollandica]|nr:DUF4236 domain-containing protein [Nitrolancea hollandica]
MRRSIRIAKGIRLNLSKTGVGVSVGGKFGRYSINSSGRRTISVRTGIPGLSYVEQKQIGGSRRRPQPTHQPPAPAKPGLFAPSGEKGLYKALHQDNVQAIEAVGRQHQEYRVLAYSLAGLKLLNTDPSRAMRLLTDAFEAGQDPGAHPFVAKYLHVQLTLAVAPGVEAELPLGRDAVGLSLAELRQAEGDLVGAIDVVEHLEPTSYAAVSLAELYAAVGKHQAVVDLTDGITNEDDLTALLLVYRGIALHELRLFDAALEAFKEALRSRSRDGAIRMLAWYERASLYASQGKQALVRRDLERIIAVDSTYKDVRIQLAALSS